MKNNIPNYITTFRIVGSIGLLFLKPFSFEFFALYTLCGISDVLDGVIARSMRTTSALGAKLDSVADLSFYAVMTVKILPELIRNLPLYIWCIVIADFAMRIVSYVFVAVRFRKFSSLHTYMNKLTGLAVFCIPYYITTKYAVPLALIGSIIAFVSSIDELRIHFTRKKNEDTPASSLTSTDAEVERSEQKNSV